MFFITNHIMYGRPTIVPDFCPLGCLRLPLSGADLGILRGGGGSGPEFFKWGGGLGSRSADIFIY